MKAGIKQIKDEVLPILKEAGVVRSSIFDSYVRGKHREDSDIDILESVKFIEEYTGDLTERISIRILKYKMQF